MTLKDRLEQKEKYDIAYRNGDALISDSDYDEFVDDLLADVPEDHPLHSSVGLTPTTRMEKLPVDMYSMNKIKTFPKYEKWLKVLAKKLGITYEEVLDLYVTLGPKLDGISLAQDENTKKTWTRGDGITGQASTAHAEAMNVNSSKKEAIISYGEAIFMKNTFDTKWLGVIGPSGNPYKNGRNTVAGKFNADDPELPIMSDIEYIRYGFYDLSNTLKLNKDKEIDKINAFNKIKFPYKLCKLSDVTEEYATLLFDEWKQLYEIDGIVVDINDYDLRLQLGRETNNNPAYARALKFSFEEVGHTTIKDVEWQVSKQGELYPTANIKPIELEGTTVKRASLYNAAHMEIKNILKTFSSAENPNIITSIATVKCKIDIIKSGQVIPKIITFHHSPDNHAKTYHLQTGCPICGSDLKWDGSKIHICCTNRNCRGRIEKELLAFFEIIGFKGMKEGTIQKLMLAGYDSLNKILNITLEDIVGVKGLGKSLGNKLIKLQTDLKVTGLPIHVAMHSSNLFKGLGSKKLLIIINGIENEYNTTLEELIRIDGIEEKSANTYLEAIPLYLDWKLKHNILTYKLEAEKPKSNKYEEYIVCFTDIRDSNLSKELTDGGAKEVKTFSNKVTHLICPDPTNVKLSKVNKAIKAKDAGKSNVIICTIKEFKEIIKDEEE